MRLWIAVLIVFVLSSNAEAQDNLLKDLMDSNATGVINIQIPWGEQDLPEEVAIEKRLMEELLDPNDQKLVEAIFKAWCATGFNWDREEFIYYVKMLRYHYDRGEMLRNKEYAPFKKAEKAGWADFLDYIIDDMGKRIGKDVEMGTDWGREVKIFYED